MGEERLRIAREMHDVVALAMATINVQATAAAQVLTEPFVSPLTAKTHLSRIMTKLNARDRAQLVVLAYECGLVVPGQRATS